MRRVALSMLAALALAWPASAQDLVVTGDGVRTVILASKFPFTIAAKPGAADYVWRVPAGVTFTETDDKIDVTAAPAGELVISVRTLTVDFDAKKVIRKTSTVTVLVGGAAPKPPDPPKPDPPVPPTGKLYFAIVRPDGPAAPAFTKIMSDPAWFELRQAGHQIKDFTVAESRRLNIPVAAGTTLPVVVTLQTGATESKVIRPAIPLPVTADGIRRLVEVPNE